MVAALLMSLIATGKMDVTMAINGAIAGLVAITADPLSPSGGVAVFVGAIGGIIVYFSILTLEKSGIDDPVGAISAHGLLVYLGARCFIYRRCIICYSTYWCYCNCRIHVCCKLCCNSCN
ncbi:MAG: hypothetical protein CM15mP108_2530 [Gammaproteobacteria bacterium]|nr:MAG: hypothetical protein CM15mP108_2530 [Gammaproteobacteria bacterium]